MGCVSTPKSLIYSDAGKYLSRHERDGTYKRYCSAPTCRRGGAAGQEVKQQQQDNSSEQTGRQHGSVRYRDKRSCLALATLTCDFFRPPLIASE